jgi:hypothetical protein
MAETEQIKKTDWQRGEDCLETIMKWVSIDKLEALAKKIDDKDFRKSMQYKLFISTL